MNPAEGTVILKQGREKSVERGHPWIFSGAIASRRGLLRVGSVVDVLHTKGQWLARGLYHPNDSVAVRLYTRDESESVVDDLFRQRVEKALDLRRSCGFGESPGTMGYRVCYSEADGLSGLVMDRFGDLLVVQISSATLMSYLPAMIDSAKESLGCKQVHVAVSDPERVGRDVQQAEVDKLSTYDGKPVEFCEHGLRFEVDAIKGQKTGFYVDQRCNRRTVGRYAKNRDVLSVYSYTGAFEVAAASAGARSVTGVDSSEPALSQAVRHAKMNGVADRVSFRKGDAARMMRSFRDASATFDMVVLDPPRFVANRNQMEKGLRGYKDINLMACKLLRPGGILATFSCSGLVTADQLQKTVSWAASDAGKEVRVLETLGQPADHPFALNIPETRYLKGLICRVD